MACFRLLHDDDDNVLLLIKCIHVHRIFTPLKFVKSLTREPQRVIFSSCCLQVLAKEQQVELEQGLEKLRFFRKSFIGF